MSQDLASTSLNAIKWNYLGTAVRTISGTVIGIVLARLLGPEPFGQVAIALLVIGIGNFLADFGLGAALIQHEDISDLHIRFTFTVQVSLGLTMALGSLGLADPIAHALQDPTVAPVLRALSPLFVLQSLGQCSAILLKRDLRFRALQTLQIMSYLIGYVGLGIPLALLNYGVWSLVTAQLAQALLYAALLYHRTRHSIRPAFSGVSAGFLGFGAKILGTNIVNWITGNFDSFIVGRVFGLISLGLYNRIFVLTYSPVNGIIMALQSVLFPVYSRDQHNPEGLRRAYLASLALAGLAVIPVFLCMSVVPQTIVSGLYGTGWSGAVPLLPPLALAMPLTALGALASPMLWSQGKVEKDFGVQAIIAGGMIVALVIASSFSIIAIAWAVFGLYALRFLMLIHAADDVLQISWTSILRILRGPLAIAAVTSVVVLVSDIFLQHQGLNGAYRLLSVGFIGAVVMLLLLVAIPHLILDHSARWGVGQVASRLPRGLAYSFLLRLAEPHEASDLAGDTISRRPLTHQRTDESA